MIDGTIVRLTMRQILGQKRSILMLLFALLPVLLALLYRLENDSGDAQEWTAEVALANLVIGILLPFTALVFGTAALGQEFEDGTAVYLLAKPIPRSTIILSKLLVAWLATAVVVTLSTVPTAMLGLSGEPDEGITLGFVVGGIVGSLAYCAAFLWLSIATSRALIVGLLYVFIWEGVVVSLFRGVKYLSISEYALGIAKAFISAPDRTFDPRLTTVPAAVFAALITAFATWYAIRSLQRWEIGEST
jgi:ABC-2 type transport system permease protein